MADNLDPETVVLLGFKRRISELSETETPTDSQSKQQLHSNPPIPFSPQNQNQKQSPDNDIVSSATANGKQETIVDWELGLVSDEGLKEKQEIDQDKLGSASGNDVVMKQQIDIDHKLFSKFVKNENEKDLAKYDYEVGFVSGIEEFGQVNKSSKEVQMDSDVDDCNKDLFKSCSIIAFGDNQTPSPFQNQENHFLVESSREISCDTDTTIKMNEVVCENVVQIGEKFGVMESKETDGKRSGCDCDAIPILKGDGGDPRCALKIEVIDDTALIETVSSSRVGNGCGKERGFVGFANPDGKEKRSRRRGKGGKKCLGKNGNEMVFTPMVEVQTGFEKKGDGSKKVYSVKEMEALRFDNIEEQRKKWVEVYCGLGPAVMREYDGLVDCNHQKQIRMNFDPRQHFRKKDTPPPILSEGCSESMGNEIENMNPACRLSVSDVDGCTVVEEECSDDDDSDAEYSNIQRPAFLVTGTPNFDSGPPEDGFEYIRRVRWEADQIPKVKVAKVESSKLYKEQTIYMPKIPDIAKCPEHLMPLKQWEDAFLADFSELRLALSHHEAFSAKISGKMQSVPSVHEEESSHQLLESIVLENFDNLTTEEVDSCQSVDCSIQSFSTADENVDVSPPLSSPKSFVISSPGNCPTLSTILEMDSVARVSMLRKHINSVETMTSLSKDDCAWLFALCATVDTPLNANTCASLRCLLRKCASLRAAKSEFDDEVVMLNILATISGKYFGQSEN